MVNVILKTLASIVSFLFNLVDNQILHSLTVYVSHIVTQSIVTVKNCESKFLIQIHLIFPPEPITSYIFTMAPFIFSFDLNGNLDTPVDSGAEI